MTVMLKYRNKLNIILYHKFYTLYKIILISHCGACLFKNFVAIVLMNKNNEKALELCCCDKKKRLKMPISQRTLSLLLQKNKTISF